MRALFTLLIFAVGAVGAVACFPNTTIEDTWRAPSMPGELSKVVTVVRAEDGLIRRKTEEQLAQQLRLQGTEAFPGYTVLTEEQRKDRNAMRAALRQQGFDGMIAVRFLGKEEQLEIYPTFDSYWGYGGYWGGAWGGYWGPYYDYYYPTVIYRVEANAYRLSDGQLVYSVISRTEDPENLDEIITETADVVAQDLARHQVTSPTQISRR